MKTGHRHILALAAAAIVSCAAAMAQDRDSVSISPSVSGDMPVEFPEAPGMFPVMPSVLPVESPGKSTHDLSPMLRSLDYSLKNGPVPDFRTGAFSLSGYRNDMIMYGLWTSRTIGLSGTFRINDRFYVSSGTLGSFINGNISLYRPGYFTSFGYTPAPDMKFQVWGTYMDGPFMPMAPAGTFTLPNTGIGASAEFRIGDNFRIGVSAGVSRVN